MKAVEQDAAERAQRRREKMKVATEWKERGNVEFKAGNYEKAIELYTEGLNHLKDFGALYTNRAQAYNKLGRFEEALEDCDLILRLEPKNSKARVHRGKALLGMRRYDDAMDAYREILQYDSKKTKMVDEYISEVQQARTAAQAEENASKRLEGGDMHSKTVTEVLAKLWKENQHLMYYAGGMRVLEDMIKSDTSRTLFRTGKGYDVLEREPFKSCIDQVIRGEKKSEVLEVVQALLDLLTQTVIQNDENCKVVIESGDFPSHLLGLLGGGHPHISRSCVSLLLRLTESSVGRLHLISKFDNASLLVGMFSYLQTSQSGAAEAAKVLNNLALEEKFSAQFRNKVEEDVLPAFERFMTHAGKSKNGNVFPSCISFMGNMTLDPVIRKQIAKRKEFWDAASHVLKSHAKKLGQGSRRDAVFSMLGLLLNVSTETSQALKDQAESLSHLMIPLVELQDEELRERAASFLTRILPHSTGGVQAACQAGIPRKLLEALQNAPERESLRSAYSRCLAAMTQVSEEARQQVVEADTELSCYLHHLSSPSDSVVANVALSLSHCVEVAGVSERLAETDIVKTLLSKTDTTNETIKQNCAITLARLATADQRHLERLRELGGIGILHSCSKYALR
ncbi:tetratricopeptide repeat protein 12-like [Diadema setosum]|uniref:tetratricopeptide repeat protein 12-like n=1 Tax=Diadema setosum TaxID=31175 RepID=UPI003B3A8BE2